MSVRGREGVCERERVGREDVCECVYVRGCVFETGTEGVCVCEGERVWV